MNKHEAIKILDEYLHFKYNVDPLQEMKFKAHRIYVRDKIYYWILIMSSIDTYNQEHEVSELVGGGVFYIDKANQNIYEIGSSPFIEWEEEFYKFKNGFESKVNWKPRLNHYLKCNLIEERYVDYSLIELNCSKESRESIVKKYIQKQDMDSFHVIKPIVKRISISDQNGKVLVSVKGNITNQVKKIVYYEFSNGFEGYTLAVDYIKKWNRINNYVSTDQYYAEVVEVKPSQEFSDWKLRLKMILE